MSQLLRYATVGGRSLKVTIATEGPGFKRLVDAISDNVKAEAGDIVATRIEAGTTFSAADLTEMNEIRIKNMKHRSDGDLNEHYSVEGWGDSGKVKDGHVSVDASKQTMAK